MIQVLGWESVWVWWKEKSRRPVHSRAADGGLEALVLDISWRCKIPVEVGKGTSGRSTERGF